ncbi:putative XS domain superfamily protein [Helianthus annuus]|nr:putative XS domain superfamily protein [Helianthus annuus]
MEFEKAFGAENLSGSSSIYAWLARANDFESQGPTGGYLRMNRDLKTVSEVEQKTAGP